MMKLAAVVVSSLVVPACIAGAPAPEPSAGPSTPVACGVRDDATAAQLSAQMQVQLDGDQIACARSIVDATRIYGLDERAAQIALATSLGETSLRDLSAGDSDRAGLYGQQVSQGWGLPDQLVDPTFATDALLDRLVVDFPDDEWQRLDISIVAEQIQGATPRGVFQAQAVDAGVLATRLWSAPAPAQR
jgi:hypothetical protein